MAVEMCWLKNNCTIQLVYEAYWYNTIIRSGLEQGAV